MFLDADGLILTNAHVACSPLPFRVQAIAKVNGSPKEVTFSKVTLLGFHPAYDLALLRVDPTEIGAAIKPVSLASALPVRASASGRSDSRATTSAQAESGDLGEMRSTSKDFYGLSYLQMDISICTAIPADRSATTREVIGVVTAMGPTGTRSRSRSRR